MRARLLLLSVLLPLLWTHEARAQVAGMFPAGNEHPFAGRANLQTILGLGYRPVFQITSAIFSNIYVFDETRFISAITGGNVYYVDVDWLYDAFPVVIDIGPAGTSGAICWRQQWVSADGSTTLNIDYWCRKGTARP